MGMRYKTVGGGAAAGAGNDFATFLQNGLNTGTFGTPTGAAGANPVGSTQGIAGVLNDLLSGGAGKLGGSMADMIGRQQENDVNNIRARFGVGGGTAFGTPGQYAESEYRAQAAPQITNAIGQLQLGALSQLFPQFGGLVQKGIPQAETAGQENPWVSAAKLGLQGAGAVAGFMAGGPMGAAAGSQLGGSIGGSFGGGGSVGNFGAPQWSPGQGGGWNPGQASMYQQLPQMFNVPTLRF